MKMFAFVRSMLALVAAVATAASAGSSSTSAAAGGRTQSGTAFVDFGQVIANGGFIDAIEDGVTGRDVPLTVISKASTSSRVCAIPVPIRPVFTA